MSPLYDRFGGQLRSAQPLLYPPNVETAALRAASPWLLNPNGSALLPGVAAGREQAWAPGILFPVPTTSAEAVALGWAAPTELWLCDEAVGNLVGKIAATALVPTNTPLQNRDFHGLPYGGSLWGKKAVEAVINTTQRFVCGDVAAVQPGLNDFTVSLLVRVPSLRGSYALIGNRVGAVNPGWVIVANFSTSTLRVYLQSSAGDGLYATTPAFEEGIHLITLCVSRTTGNAWFVVDGTTGANSDISAHAGRTLTSAAGFYLYDDTQNLTFGGQICWTYICIGTAAAGGHAAMWGRLSSNGLGTPNTYTRANPLVVSISASRVACYAAGQLAVGYSAGFAVDGNALQTGLVAEDAITFQPVGSDNFYTNTTPQPPGTKATMTGPSGMLDAARLVMGGAWGGATWAYGPGAGGAVIAGATNVPWRFDVDYKRATVGTTARTGLQFLNDPGGTETFSNIINDAATPADWVRGGGTVTPVGAAHTRCYYMLGANANNENADFAEIALVQNRSAAALAWRRVGTAAAAGTSIPALSFTNVSNRRYDPARGQSRIRVSGFAGTNGATFFDFGGAGVAGAMVLDVSGGNLRLRVYDAAAALTATILCGAVSSAEHTYDVVWDHANPVPGLAGVYAAVLEGTTVLGTWLAGWTVPVVDVSPLAVGATVAGAGAARCFISLA